MIISRLLWSSVGDKRRLLYFKGLGLELGLKQGLRSQWVQASVVDTVTGTDSLSAGFAVSLNNGEGAAFLLGDKIRVGIAGTVTIIRCSTWYNCDNERFR